jgi:hypothetical protein
MSGPTSGQTTGLNRDDDQLRRRNVSGYEKANGAQVVRLEAEDTKKLRKVRLKDSEQITTC